MDVHSQADGGWKVTVVTSVLILMLTLMVVGRIVSRSLKKSKLQKDDYMLLLATVGCHSLLTRCGTCRIADMWESYSPLRFVQLVSRVRAYMSWALDLGPLC